MDHKKLDAWILSVELTEEIYFITGKFPKQEVFGITSQLRRAAVSVPTNIAEGAARRHDKEMIHFLYIALGSNAELETLLYICKRINYISDIVFVSLSGKLTRIKVMILGLIKYLNSK